ncbi:hypothetical protein HQ550_03775 [bacterium]|nr:hypothetical protein [bacterium]
MKKSLVVGILRETKEGERRAPLIPSDVEWLIKRGISVEVESNPKRVFSDSEYKKNGAKVLNRFQKASLLLGIKEPTLTNLYPHKVYMIFSHTTKGQSNNMPLLKGFLKNNITLIDYEKIVDLHGKRIVYFGRFAGVCGLVDSLHYLGKRLEYEGIKNPFLKIKPAYKYSSFKNVKKAMIEVDRCIRRQGFDKRISPFIIGITGHGNVSMGVQEILELLDPVEIHPKDMLQFVRHKKGMIHKLYKIVFLKEEKFRAKDRRRFHYEEYLKNPKRFESNLDMYLPHLNILIHASFWDRQYPRMVTKEMVCKLARKKNFRLRFITDISCDINGSIELTYKATSFSSPTFTYDSNKNIFIDGYKSRGITVLAIDSLPSELPKDASIEFSSLVRNYVYQIAAYGINNVTHHIDLAQEIRKAIITEGGRLTKRFSYLKRYISV